ncbi:MAG: LysE family transporter [Saprospiraceae bacterium]
MHLFFQGIYAGLLLALLVGPLIVALLQASLEQGTRAGLTVGAGIWISDLLYILCVYYGVNFLHSIIQWPYFTEVLGLVGVLVLVVTGLHTLLSQPPDLTGALQKKMGQKSYLSLMSKGFAINTFNPFTVFFWVSVMEGVVVAEQYNPRQSFFYFLGLFGTIIATDTLKVLFAKAVRHQLTPRHLWWVRRIAGIALIVFAVALAIRIFW